MFQALFDYFYNFFVNLTLNDSGWASDEISVKFNGALNIADEQFSMSLADYLSLICSLVSLILIIVLCCLFIYRLIRLVGRLFSGGTL